MKLDKSLNILIVGLGLLGGSYAKALKKQGYKISAVTRSQSSIDFALENALIDRGTTEIDPEMIGSADLVVFALYPHIFTEWVKENQKYFKSGAVITDVTGVKGCIVYEIQEMLRDDVEFIAAHPMAGREVCGVENSDDAIFKGANYIVVPTDKNTNSAIELCKDLGYVLGFADISVLSPESHDEMIAFLSQLTHCIAVALMCANDNPDMIRYTGDSFRDLTRIANINDEMWSELFIANRPALLREMNRYRRSFELLYEYIAIGDRNGIRDMMKLSTKRRKAFERK